MPAKPKVSVVCVAYNQQDFIAQAIEGFIKQKVDFTLEILVADDCSTDNTPKIVKQYAEKHPKTIRPILRKKNIGIQKNFIETLKSAGGKYIALCEGDDYWTDPHKLQRQVDLMEANPDYALCFHPVKVHFEDEQEDDFLFPNPKDAPTFTNAELLRQNFIQTNSVMYRAQSYDALPDSVLPIDWYLHLFHARFGRIGFLPTAMSVYRKHAGGVWWESGNDQDELWQKHGLAHLSMYVELQKLYPKPEDSQLLQTGIDRLITAFVGVDERHGTDLVAQVIDRFPQAVRGYIADQQRVAEEAAARLRQSQDELNLLKSSKLLKLRDRVRGLGKGGRS